MRGRLLSIVFILCLGVFLLQKSTKSDWPIPTTGKTIIKDGEQEGHGDRRRAWLEEMHQSAPHTDWRQLEYLNQLERQRRRAENANWRSDCNNEILAGGHINGQWRERGSNNQAGSVYDTEYDSAADVIWIISAGGTLWKGDRSGLDWEVVNQDLAFDPGILKFIAHGNGRRLLATAGRIPHYSDDDGETWTAAQGITHTSSWGNVGHSVVLHDENSTYYTLAKPDYWDNLKLYKSTDQGTHFHPVKTFTTHDFDRFDLCSPPQNNQLYLVEKKENNEGRFYRVNVDDDTLIPLNPEGGFSFGSARANLAVWASDTLTVFYTYTETTAGGRKVRRSEDFGNTWTAQGQLPARPWSVGLYVLPSDPNKLLMGEVECFRSEDAGESWEKINEWWEYYDDVAGKLHADIMYMREFQTDTGQDFLLISHHGGLTYSEAFLDDQMNISLQDLNTSQYYSVRTDPIDPNFVYAGSQDQGLQLADSFEDENTSPEAFDQVISGDYGHITFAQAGQSLWCVYPGGWVTCYEQAQSGHLSYSYDLESENESVWLPPLASVAAIPENVVYLAGGNINGGPGSYLIRLHGNNGEVQASQVNFNFKAESAGGEISAIGISPTNPHRMYTATTNGRFFASENGGDAWTQTVNFLPSGHYLYGQKILVSTLDEEVVYLAGSGYSNPAVYRSDDGGENFAAMNTGLPPTLVFDLAANADESLLFAATEAGPYVYIAAEEKWFDLAGQCAPTQTYWSVEYIPSLQVARFGTYGRGIWDFELDTDVDIEEPIATQTDDWQIGPNPSNGQFTLYGLLQNADRQKIRVFDATGRLLHQELLAGSMNLDLSDLPSGIYWVKIGKIAKKVIIL
ncbi:MAG: hypothetical protein DHS20C18_53150 [Saprospiraceae bacterium]|nr:MAG: hypothetical protein DHS20C18_53150 [Saprospiraceae bacterium]